MQCISKDVFNHKEYSCNKAILYLGAKQHTSPSSKTMLLSYRDPIFILWGIPLIQRKKTRFKAQKKRVCKASAKINLIFSMNPQYTDKIQTAQGLNALLTVYVYSENCHVNREADVSYLSYQTTVSLYFTASPLLSGVQQNSGDYFCALVEGLACNSTYLWTE